jgi:WD40 repeat protein
MLAPETVLQGRYRIIGPTAKGGMGSVYRARDLRLRCDVALKQTLFTDEAYRQAFEREAQILARLRHQNLPRVIDHFIENRGQFLVMEFIYGEDLGYQLSRLGKRFASPRAMSFVLRWADQLLDVLHYLHTRPIPVIHRDIKPKNLKLTANHDIILLDFGLARGGVTVATGGVDPNEGTADAGVRRKITGFTPPYAPIEQMRDSEPDARSDIYALGATLYHLLTGTMPADAMTRVSRKIDGKADALRPLRDLAPHVSAPVAQVIEQALALTVEDRPQSAQQMREMMQRAQRPSHWQNAPQDPPVDAPVQAAAEGEPSSQPEPGHEPASQPDDSATRIIAPPSTPSSLTPSQVSTTPAFHEPASAGTLFRRLITGNPIRSLAFSPSGELLAAGYDDHTVGIWYLSGEHDSQTLRGHTSSVRGVCFHPAGEVLVSGSDDETVRVWGLADWVSRQMLTVPGCSVESVQFSPDGKVLAVGGWGSSIALCQVEENQRIVLVESLPAPFVHDLAFDPRGDLLAAGCYDGNVYLWDTADYQPVGFLGTFPTFVLSTAFSPDGALIAASSNTTIRIWRTRDRALIDTLQAHRSPVRSIAFSPDGRLLASASEDCTVRLWRVEDGAMLPMALEHSAGISSVCFSPDGSLIASSTHDGRICLWHAPILA